MAEKYKYGEWTCFSEYENIDSTIYRSSSILKVDGGNIYHEFIMHHANITNSMCFVPDIDLARYQSHLRDAYKQGYLKGQEDAKYGIMEEP